MTPKMKQTKQRSGILQVMRDMAEKKYHPTAQEVYEELRRRGVGVWLATVYRNLEKFDEMGLIKKISVPGHSDRFDGTPTKHSHIKCVVCGMVDDLPPTAQIDVSMNCKDPCGYKVLEIQAEILGICEKCQKEGFTGSNNGNEDIN